MMCMGADIAAALPPTEAGVEMRIRPEAEEAAMQESSLPGPAKAIPISALLHGLRPGTWSIRALPIPHLPGGEGEDILFHQLKKMPCRSRPVTGNGVVTEEL